MTRLKAVLNALSDSYPSESATTETELPVFSSWSTASIIRQRVKYSTGENPTVALNFCANAERDMPAELASA